MAQLNDLLVTGSSRFLNDVNANEVKTNILQGTIYGTGTAQQDKGSGVSPRYFPVKWTFNTGHTPADGDIINITLPIAGHGWGDWISIDNGVSYHPANVTGTTRLTTHYGVGTTLQFVFDADGQTNSMTPVNGADAVNGSNITGGCWRVVNFYDTNSNNYDRNLYNVAIKCGSTAIVAGNIIVGKDGVFHHLKDGTAFDINYPILYANGAIAANATSTNNYDVLAINLQTTQTITLTAYLPVFIKGTISGNIFTPVSTTPLTQTVPTTADSYYYMLLGVAYSTTNIYLDVDHRIFAYKNGKFGEIVNDALSVNGYTVAKSVPSNAVFTDANVTQTATTTNANYEVLFSVTADNTTRTEGARKNSNILANPSTGLLQSTQAKSTVNKSMLTGTGTAAQDKGSGVSPRYFPAKWTFNTGITVADGDMFTIKLPVAGHSYGEFISVNNGTNYYPVGYNTNAILTTHFPVGAIITVVFKADGVVNSIYPVAGGDSKVNVSGGAFYVMNLYDSGNSNTYDRNRFNAAIKVWGTALVAANIIVANTSGLYMHLKQNAAFDISYPILYLNEAVAANGTTTNTYDIINFATATTQSGTWTAYKPVYIKGQLSGTTFTPVSATPLTQTVPTTADGYEYIFLGYATATTTVYLQETHPIYAYRNGKFGQIVNDADSVNGYTVAKSVPSNAVFTDTKVTAVGNHYIPTSSGTYTASASGATAAWSIDVVKGVTLQKDAAGHITGMSVTSGKIPANPNTDVSVTQTNDTSTDNDFRVLLSGSADNNTKTEGAKKSSRLRFNPSKGALMEGSSTTASGNYSHAEGDRTNASGYSAHAEGYQTTAFGNYSHAEGVSTCAYLIKQDGTSITSCHSEGASTTASGNGAHAEGYKTYAFNSGTSVEHAGPHAEGSQTSAIGIVVHAEGYQTAASSSASHAEGFQTTASSKGAHAEGQKTIASGIAAHAEGLSTSTANTGAHAEGASTWAYEYASHAEGYGCGIGGGGSYSHAEGYYSRVNGGSAAHAEGWQTTCYGGSTHSEGSYTYAYGSYSHAEGAYTTSQNTCSHSSGHYNAAMTTGGAVNNTTGTAFVIGNGTGASALKNAFSVQFNGVVKAASTITASTTADYAEYFEWADENPNSEDRVGYFVTFDNGDKIRFATSEDDYILGVTSGEPFVLGNGDCDVWNGMVLRDEFRRIIYEPAPEMIDVAGGGHIPKMDKDGNPVYNGTRPKLNPNYDPNQPYISRADRPEWCPVGMLGVLAVRDDGTCEVNGYATVRDDATATKYTEQSQNKYRVIRRNTENVVEIVFR